MCCVLMLVFVMISMFLSKIILFKHRCVALLTIYLFKSSLGYILRYNRKHMAHFIKWFFKLIWTMVSVLRDWKTLALIEVRAPKYFVCHPKITPCSTSINPKQAFACFQSKHAQEQSSLYLNLCMGKTFTCQAFYQVCGKMISVASFLQKLITKSWDPISS